MDIPATRNLRIKQDIKITVPAEPTQLTTYILLEQGDWFEDEIHFVRRFIQPEMQVLDIGANFGCYSLSIAKLLANRGHLWAFEPCAHTARCLAQSIVDNGFDNVTLLQQGVSDQQGEGRLFISSSAEYHSLTERGEGSWESVNLTTLDAFYLANERPHLDFIKLDAEGEEQKIVEAAEQLLQEQSPLVMFEYRNGKEVNSDLIEQFNGLGYQCYILQPGLPVLIPFDVGQEYDSYTLNLFCCKLDRARELSARGLLVRSRKVLQKPIDLTPYVDQWRRYCAEIEPYRAYSESAEFDEDVAAIMGSYLVAKEAFHLPLPERVVLLTNAAQRALELAQLPAYATDPGVLASFARVIIEAGQRTAAVRLLDNALTFMKQNPEPKLSPCLPASARFDNIKVGQNQAHWVHASLLDAFIDRLAYSSYFSHEFVKPLVERQLALGYRVAAMGTLLELIAQKATVQT